MSFLLLNTQWVCLPFFRVLDVRKFCGCVTSRVQLRPPLSRGNTSLGSRSNLRAHWHAWKPPTNVPNVSFAVEREFLAESVHQLDQ